MQDNTGFALHVPEKIATTTAPSVEQLMLIQQLDPHNLRTSQLKDNTPGERSPR